MKLAKRIVEIILTVFIFSIIIFIGDLFIFSYRAERRANSTEGNIRMLNGVFTNGVSKNNATFSSFEFRGNNFILTINIPFNSYDDIPEHIVDEVMMSQEGIYFIRIRHHGKFYISNDNNAESIELVYSCGNIVRRQFSRTDNTIAIGNAHLTEVTPLL